jgi:hypothetical protein
VPVYGRGVPVHLLAVALAALFEVFDHGLGEYSDALNRQIRDNPTDRPLVRDRADLDQLQAAMREFRHRFRPDTSPI